jgi:CRISPR type IV-associated protein Csf1
MTISPYLASPSKLAHTGLGESSVPGPIDEPFTCNLCGFDFEGGGYPYKQGPKFNNHADTHGTEVICQHCKVVTTGSQYILQNKCAVYTENGAYSLNKDIDIAAFVYHPPAPPFLAVYGTIKQQHLVWRSAVANSIDAFPMRFGDEMYVINRKALLGVIDQYRETLKAINEYRLLKNPKAKPLPSFFAEKTSAIRSADAVSACMMNRFITSLLGELDSNNDGEAELLSTIESLNQTLNALSYGELFLLIAASKHEASTLTMHHDYTNR